MCQFQEGRRSTAISEAFRDTREEVSLGAPLTSAFISERSNFSIKGETHHPGDERHELTTLMLKALCLLLQVINMKKPA